MFMQQAYENMLTMLKKENKQKKKKMIYFKLCSFTKLPPLQVFPFPVSVAFDLHGIQVPGMALEVASCLKEMAAYVCI